MYFRVRIRIGVKVISRVRIGLGIKGQVSELSVGKNWEKKIHRTVNIKSELCPASVA